MTLGSLSSTVHVAKALAHPGRLRILAMLSHGELCVCQITAVLGLATSTVSSHLSDLRRAGFVTERKHKKWVHYELVGQGPLSHLVRQMLRLVEDDERVRKDARVASALRKIPLETFCSTIATARRPRPPTGRTGR